MNIETIIRYVLLLVGVAIILFIMWDGLRRKKQRHQQKLDREEEAVDHKEFFDREILGTQISEPHKHEIVEIKYPSADEINFEETLALPIKIDEYVSIYIIPKRDRRFGGYDLLQTILANGFHYGELQLFHCFENKNRSSKKLFTLASAEEPGDFDLSKMGTFTCNGLILYMKTHDHEDPAVIFDQMFEVAEQLADDLRGELKMANQESWTEQITQAVRLRLVETPIYSST